MIDIKSILYALTLLIVGQVAMADHQDKFYLRDGQVLTGKLDAPFFHFDTAYGQFELPNSACRTIDGKDEDLVTFHSINREIITGLIRRDIVVERSDQVHVKIGKESILKIVCVDRAKPDAQTSTYFQMLDGDKFYGSFLDLSFLFTTSFTELNTKFADVLRIELVRGQTQMLLTNGDLIKGYMSSPFIMIRGLYGFDMKIPNTSIKLIERRKGRI